MKNILNFKAILLLAIVIACSPTIHAQVNCNPDPTGPPWWASSVPQVTPQIQAELESIPFVPSSIVASNVQLPVSVDNSQRIWFRPIFQQSSRYSTQAAAIGYVFTYEINRLRNLSGASTSNQYPPLFTWNFLNKVESDEFTWFHDGWDIIKECGIPNEEDYTNPTRNPDLWMTGYDKYYNALLNKVNLSYMQINVATTSGLDMLKRWLYNHNDNSTSGGVACFYVNMLNAGYGTIPEGSSEAGKDILLSFGNNGTHAMTVVGYNDNIKYDFNGDGQYTNPGTDMTQWEIGALKIANTWGTVYGTDGYIYIPYRLLAISSGIISPRNMYIISLSDADYTPDMTLNVSIQHPCRDKVDLYAGYAANVGQASPSVTIPYNTFNHDAYDYAPCLPMQGTNNGEIKLCLDYSHFLENYNVGKVFFKLTENGDMFNQHNGTISDFSLIDYRWDEEFELDCPISSTSIQNNSSTILGIDYDLLPFDTPLSSATYSTNKVARRTVTIGSGATITMDEMNLEMYGTDSYDCELIVDFGATLNTQDSVFIVAKRGTCRVIVNGTMNGSVTYRAENGAELEIVRGQEGIIDLSNASFENCTPPLPMQNSAPEKTFTPKFAKSGVEYSTLIGDFFTMEPLSILTTKFEGDTTLFGRQYVKITQTDLKGITDLDIIGYVRETEDGKVFLFTERTRKEYLIYDFGMEPGDSFNSIWLNSPENRTYIRLDYTTEEFIGGETRTCYHTSSYCEKNGYWCCPVVWVEGIGSLLSPFIVELTRGFGFARWTPVLLCYKENGELVYINEEYDDCEYGFSFEYDSEWSVMSYNNIPGTDNYAYTTRFIDGNTIIHNGYEYTELLREGVCCGIYREWRDNSQIYYRQANDDGTFGEEHLMYDYSVKIGDTITAGVSNVEFVVADITEATLLSGQTRKMIHLADLYDDMGKIVETWIEGIGSNYGFDAVGGWQITGGNTELLCYKMNGALIWMNPEYNTCEYYLSIDEFEADEVSVYPNPGENVLNIQTSLQNARIEVYNVLGKVVYEQEITGDIISISTDKWAKGMYLWRVFSNEQEVENGKWIKQ